MSHITSCEVIGDHNRSKTAHSDLRVAQQSPSMTCHRNICSFRENLRLQLFMRDELGEDTVLDFWYVHFYWKMPQETVCICDRLHITVWPQNNKKCLTNRSVEIILFAEFLVSLDMGIL